MNAETKAREILLIEDNKDYAETLTKIIRDLLEHKVTAVHDGKEGIKVAEEGKYDLFLVDINLPGMVGWDVAMALRKISRYENTPIIAMTAYDDSDTRKMSLRSGCNVYLTKPVDIDALTEIITIYLQGFG